jgi:hypothetical protein
LASYLITTLLDHSDRLYKLVSPHHLVIILSSGSHRRLVLPLPPIHPAPSIVPDVLIPNLLCLLTSRSAPLARPTVKDHLLLGQGFVEHVFLDERTCVIVGREVLLEGAQGERDGTGDGSEGDLVWFTDVCRAVRRGGISAEHWWSSGNATYRQSEHPENSTK